MSGERLFIADQCIDPSELYTPADLPAPPSLECDPTPEHGEPAPKGRSRTMVRAPQDSYTEITPVPFPGYWNHFTDPSIHPVQRALAGAALPIMASVTVVAGFLGSPFGCASPTTSKPTGSEGESESEGEDGGRPPVSDGSPRSDRGLVGPDGKPGKDAGADASADASAPDGGTPDSSTPAEDGGVDAGTDAGETTEDAGAPDSGPDAGVEEPDAGIEDPDAGSDAGPTPDAGPEEPDGGGPIVVDEDHDTYPVEVDCNDNDASIYPGAPETPYDGIVQDCNRDYDLNDVDGDGVPLLAAGGPDCDDNDSTVYQNLIGYQDVDGDGYTIGAAQTICSGATLAAGFISDASVEVDCNDDLSSTHPGAPQRFNGDDTNCNGTTTDTDLSRDAVTIIGQNDGDLAGYAMAGGDVNGDGSPDVIVGSPGFNNPFAEGKADIIFGGEDVFIPGASWNLGTDQDVSMSGAGAWGLGESVLAIDADGDGIDDLFIGIPGFNNGYCGGTCGDGDGSMTGAILYVHGRENWDAPINFYDIDFNDPAVLEELDMGLILGGPEEGIGQRLSDIGDINGDGRGELLVGGGNGSRCDMIPALPYSGVRNKSEIMLTEGGIHLHDTTGTPFDGWYCHDIASGDIDGDGLADFVAADIDRYDQAGNVVAIMGSPTFPSDVNFSTLSSYADLRYMNLYGNGRRHAAGSSLAAGAAGIFVGVPGESGAFANSGKIYHVPPAAVISVVDDTNPDFPNGSSIRLDGPVFTLGGSVLDGDVTNARLSAYGLALSDTRGDGSTNLVTSAWTYGGDTAGRGFYFNISSMMPGTENSAATAVHTVTGVEGTHFGLHVVGDVDVDGDGTDDPMFSAIGTLSAPAGPGRVHIFPSGSQ